MVAFLTRLDEIVVGNLQRGPDGLELPCHVIDVGLGLDTKFTGAQSHLVGVLVIAHQEMDGGAFHAPEPSLNVRPDLLERGPDMRATVGVIDRRRDVKPCRLVHHPDP